jgi:protein-tyrosine-phosphatase/predicted ATP-grasp superfamily ATP-dependent carboligase
MNGIVHQPTGRVLVLGDNDLAGLAIVRSLGRMGLEVHLAAFEENSITRHSRYAGRVHHFGHPLAETEQFLEKLAAALQAAKFDLVIPTSDKALAPLMPHRSRIEEFSRFVACSDAGFEVTSKKDLTIRLAEKCGIPVPPTRVVRSVAEIDAFEAPRRYPVVLKPQRSVCPGSTQRNEVKFAYSNDELRSRLADMVERCPVLVQEFCLGRGIGLSVLARGGNVFAAFQHERLHEPPRGGAGSYRRSMPLNEELLAGAKRVCQELGWSGPAMFEYKQPPDGAPALLMEINGRFWGSMALAIQAGVDFPRLTYESYVLGRETSTFGYRVPCYTRHTLRDFGWFIGNLRTPKGRSDMTRVGWPTLFGEILNVCLWREGYDVESLRDPMPAVVGWSRLIRQVLAGVLRKATRPLLRMGAARRTSRLRRDAAFRSSLAKVRSVLFVCTGNINRSAVAEVRLKSLLRSASREVSVASVGVLPWEGRTTGKVSAEVAHSMEIDLSTHRSRHVTSEILSRYDLIVAMEHEHLIALKRVNHRAMSKPVLLSVFDDEGSDLDVLDPDGKDRAVFANVYARICRCVDRLEALLKASVAKTAVQPVAADVNSVAVHSSSR